MIVHDMVSHRMAITKEGGVVRILREYRIDDNDTEWHLDHDAGVVFGAEYLDEVIGALVALKESTE